VYLYNDSTGVVASQSKTARDGAEEEQQSQCKPIQEEETQIQESRPPASLSIADPDHITAYRTRKDPDTVLKTAVGMFRPSLPRSLYLHNRGICPMRSFKIITDPFERSVSAERLM
jgi:hypothetical protein